MTFGDTDNLRLPLLPLRGTLAFPNTILTFDVGRPKSVAAVERAMDGDRRLFVVPQRDSTVERPRLTDLYGVGTVVTIKQIVRLPDETIRVLAEGENRAVLLDVTEDADILIAAYMTMPEPTERPDTAGKASMRVLKSLARRLMEARGLNQAELAQTISGERMPGVLCDIIAANLLTGVESRQKVLECGDAERRLATLTDLMSEEIGIEELEKKISARVHEQIETSNHEYYLREQMRAIQQELKDDDDEDVRELRRRIRESDMPEDARAAAEKELSRLARTTVNSPESGVSMNYIEFMLSLPWKKSGELTVDIQKARRVLEGDHYGMRDVKDRLIEHLAVMGVQKAVKGPILCLVGPPGVGKTSVARSVARALGRPFCQMSLGGVHDEAEIRGHRRTYVGALPGRILSAIENCKRNDPVFLLDEIDKLSRDMRGDPASALLEALDPEQNSRFRDHYLDTPFDLSKVLFITTANTTDTIDRALLDRMEVIEVPSYTLEDKLKIARKYLLPKQIGVHALGRGTLRVTPAAMRAVIDRYTRESGVRELERLTAKLCRKTALQLMENPETKSVSVRPDDLEKLLGTARYLRPPVETTPSVGTVNGLAWTSVGGEVMPIEALVLPGTGKIEITGLLGDVMKESAHIALTAARARLGDFGVAPDFFAAHDLHIHVPEGAVHKDGPSAGVALACALLSAATGIPARRNLAMTGEITLLGAVLPIGGVKEKLLAAHRAGIGEILLPAQNEKDLEEIDGDIRSCLSVHLIGSLDEALGYVLSKLEAKRSA